MAFVNQLFPNPRQVSDVQMTWSLPTTIVGTGQSEYRIQKIQQFKKAWVWPSRAMSTIDRRNIQNFMTDVAKFSMNSFLFLDPDNHRWTNVQLTSTGSGSTFYLTERGGADTHPIFHYASDVTTSLGGTGVSATLTTVNGLPALNVPGATPSSTVLVNGTFYYAARFNSAEWSASLTAMQRDPNTPGGSMPWHDTVNDITLTEVFE